MNQCQREIIGLLPAAGKANRISPLPCSKEVYPIGFRRSEADQEIRPKVVCHYLLEKMRFAGVQKAFVVLRKGKWDIPAYLRDGNVVDMHLAYLMMRLPFGVPYTLDQAYPFVQNATITFGFPDILFEPEDAFVRLLARQVATRADIVLGLFPTRDSRRWDMVDLDEAGSVRRVEIKPLESNLQYSWIIAVWAPAFTRFVHEHLQTKFQVKTMTTERELFFGEVIQAAIDSNLRVEGMVFSDGTCLDIGTPEDLIRAADKLIPSS